MTWEKKDDKLHDRPTDRPTDRQTDRPLISVIIPVYNTQDYLERCLNSVRNNTYSDLEILCVNDGSTDESGRILKEFAKRDTRMRVLEQENGGVSSARNLGLDAACGEYVAFVDSDDRVHERYFEVLLEAAQEHDADLVVCNLARQAEVDVPGEIKTHVMDRQECQRAAMRFYVHSKLYRRKVLSGVRFHEGLNFGEDTFFNLNLLCDQPELKAVYADAELYFYTERTGSLSHSETSDFGKILQISDACREKAGEGRRYYDIFLTEALKKFLDYRRLSMFLTGVQRKERGENCAKRRPVYRKMTWSASLPMKQKMMFIILLYMPFLYRMWNLYHDRTMLEWERQQKKKRKHRSA